MLFGCAMAVWGNPALDFDKGAKPSKLELGAAAAGIGLLLVTFLVRDPVFRESIRYSIQGVGLYPLFFVAIRHPTLLVCRFLNLRWVRFLGTLSYSLYLIHQVVIFAIEGNLRLPWAAQTAAALVISLLLSVTIYRYVEKPCAKLRSSLTSGRRRARALPQSSPEAGCG